MNKLKDNWELIKLGEVCESISETHNFRKKELIFLNTGDIYRGEFLHCNYSDVDAMPGQAKKSIRKHDTLFSEIRPANGHYAYVDFDADDYVVSTKLIVLRGKNCILPKYLYLLITSRDITDWLQHLAESRSGTFPQITFAQIADIEINLPPKADQRKIISIILAYDSLIKNNNRHIRILEEMGQTIYDEWFVKFCFPGHSKMKMVDSELGKLPERWEAVKVGDIIERLPSGKKYDNRTVLPKGKVPVLDQGKSGIIGYHNNEPDVIASEENPIIIFANHTCYQRIIMFPFSAIQNVIPFLPKEDRKRDIYWLHWVTKDLIKFHDYKGHFPEFASKKIIFPSVDICNAFGELIKPMLQLRYKLEQKNKILQESRDLLLPKLISREIDVANLDIKTEDLE